MATALDIPLSDKTSVFVNSRSKNKDLPYAGLKRTKPGDAAYKRLFYLTLQNIMMVLDYIPRLKALTQLEEDRQNVNLELDKCKTVGVCTYNGQKYISFQKRGKELAPFMNLDMYEFKRLTECAEQIRATVKELMEIKSAPMPTYVPRGLTLYKWMYICPVTGKLVKEAERWYLNRHVCRSEGVAWDSYFDLTGKTYEKRPEMFSFDSTFTLPDNGTLAKKAFIYAIKHIIELIRDRDCEACADNLPFHNMDHDLGCCLEWDVAVEKFYQEHILDQTDLQDMVVRIIRTINDHLPEKERQGLLKEKLEKTNWPSVIDVIHYDQTLGQDLLQVFKAAENLSAPSC